ncbi:MAG: hypothetical protein FWE71_10330 [Nocardioidaceae bacterium]|nr:hypothetical protein [Nocardioidaceae bacterium]MCL2614872.1 hypothetical protein [Nocardioidaceae bacterium]
MLGRRKVRPVTVDPHTGEVVSPRPFIGLCLLAAAFFLYAAGVMVAAWWVAVIGMVVWLVLLTLALRWWPTRPGRLLGLGIAAVVIWFPLTIGGGIISGGIITSH